MLNEWVKLLQEIELKRLDSEMQTITLTKSESKLFDKSTENTPLGKLLNMVVFRGNGIIEIHYVDKFREFLNDKILGAEFYRKTNPRKYYLMKADNVVFKSVLSKLDKEVNK